MPTAIMRPFGRSLARTTRDRILLRACCNSSSVTPSRRVVAQHFQHDFQVALRLLRLAAERRVKRTRPLVFVEAAIGRVGQAGIDQRPVEPAAGVVADDHAQQVGGVAQRRIGRRPAGHQDDVLLRHLFLGHDLEAAGAGRLAHAVAADRPRLPVAAVLLDQLHQLRPVEMAGRGDGDVRGDVAARRK